MYKDTSLVAKEVMLGQLDKLKVEYNEAVDACKKTEHDMEAVCRVRNRGKAKFTAVGSCRTPDGLIESV